MIVIYTKQVTNRIKYAFDFVFVNYFGIDYEIISDASHSKNADKFYLSYSTEKTENYFSIFQDELLLEDSIKLQKLFISKENDIPVFFQTDENFDIRFDLFAAIFYLITRYEEYLHHEQDEHGRYKSSNSILSNAAFNFSPIVEIWLDYFKQELVKQFPGIIFKNHEFEYQPTFDIDNAFQYLGRNWLHKPPNIFNKKCRNVLLKKEKDAFDTFDFIQQEIITNQLQPIFFFLMSDEDKHDSNVSPNSTLLYFQINALSNFQIGIHPSYNTTTFEKIKIETTRLFQILDKPITLSRQHFLRFKFPETILNLMQNNIEIDYTLAYPDVIGFRAGYSREINFFDLTKNITTKFTLQPSSLMDATFEYYQNNLTNDEILDKFLPFFYLLKKINGKLVPIFHNDLLAIDKYQQFFKSINQLATHK